MPPRKPLKIETADGSTLDLVERGVEYDLHLRAADGRTVATVEMSRDDVRKLLIDAAECM
ncbi:hypothetical protein [Streptomyces fractus]|uniref:hypothetical protein n=1 Tax=Streptomyces fractus TaxID=641806 RepID=UPI003CF818A9